MRSISVIRIDIAEARALANRLLGDLGDRWLHTAGVARRAADLSATVGAADREMLVAAAWLHDIGYAQTVRDTGFHPVDGARLLDREGWPRRLSALVAHHSGACFVARARGLESELACYAREESAVADTLTYADQTTGSRGERLGIDARLADMLRRHGPDSTNARVHHLRAPFLRQCAHRVEARLALLGRTRSAGRSRLDHKP